VSKLVTVRSCVRGRACLSMRNRSRCWRIKFWKGFIG